MSLLSGDISLRQYRVTGPIPEDWRTQWTAKLAESRFVDDPTDGPVVRVGWTHIHNVLDTDFDAEHQPRFIYNDSLIVCLRADKRTLPKKLLMAHLDKQQRAWCAKHDRKRCPKDVRDNLRETLEMAWYKRTLPKVQVSELVIDCGSREAITTASSVAAADLLRKATYMTLGVRLVPLGPLDFYPIGAVQNALLDTVPERFGESA